MNFLIKNRFSDIKKYRINSKTVPHRWYYSLNCTGTTFPMYVWPSVLMSMCRTIGPSDYRAVKLSGRWTIEPSDSKVVTPKVVTYTCMHVHVYAHLCAVHCASYIHMQVLIEVPSISLQEVFAESNLPFQCIFTLQNIATLLFNKIVAIFLLEGWKDMQRTTDYLNIFYDFEPPWVYSWIKVSLLQKRNKGLPWSVINWFPLCW